jgi:hypothetical protein
MNDLNSISAPRIQAKEYLDLYAVRSSVAHGGRSSKLDAELLERYQAAVRWAAWRMIGMRDTFAPSSENQVDELFDDLRWSLRTWPTQPSDVLERACQAP